MVQNQVPVLGSGNCPVCRGTGWELYRATVFDYGFSEELYYARKCPKCSGLSRSKDRTGVPEEFSEADITKFSFESYKEDMSRLKTLAWSFYNQFSDKWQKSGKGLYLWSKTPGSGKTFLSCCLAKSVMMKNNLQMKFITVPDYISKVGESYKRDRGEFDESAVYRECPLLIFDDIGSQMDKDWQRQEVFRLVNQRLANGLVTIYTSNMNVENLNVDDRTKDRIIKTSVVIQMPEESIRRKKAAEEQNEFLKGIL